MEQGRQQQLLHKVAACQVVEEKCQDSGNTPGNSNVPMIAVISGESRRTSCGEVNAEEVELLRDTGSSVSIVRSALVAPEQYTGKQITCLLVDHCVKKFPETVMEGHTEFYKGSLPVICIDRCIYDLIGNDIYKHGSGR